MLAVVAVLSTIAVGVVAVPAPASPIAVNAGSGCTLPSSSPSYSSSTSSQSSQSYTSSSSSANSASFVPSSSSSSSASSSPDSIQIIRYDRASPFSPHDLTHQTFTAQKLPSSPFDRLKDLEFGSSHTDGDQFGSGSNTVTEAVKPFNITFTCKNVLKKTCEMAKTSFENAANRIAQALFIVNTIQVSAYFHSFCDESAVLSATDNSTASSSKDTDSNSGATCSRRNTLGQASAAAYFSAKPVNSTSLSWFFYPQALVKQLKQDYTLQYNTFDIIAEFNSDFNFWFSSSEQAIQPSQTDFEFVVAHEISHGLGIESSLIQWSSAFSSLDAAKDLNISSRFLAPPFNARGTMLNTAVVSSWQPPSIFDGQLEDAATGKPLRDIAKDIFAFTPANLTFRDFITQFQASGAPFKAASALYELATAGTNSIRFAVPSSVTNQNSGSSSSTNAITPSNPIPASLLSSLSGTTEFSLQTSTVFSPGTSIVHVAYSQYWTSPDFLMIPAVQDWAGVPLDGILANVTQNGKIKTYGAYGPVTVAMLASIGWATKENPVVGSVFINPNPDGPVVPNMGGASSGVGRASSGNGLGAVVVGFIVMMLAL
ncbi:hypothetical protein HDU97_005271 [Phlyctochytrium planicorne]|nr:hypothetical protein HDU97_005271 [Phlyctochytrium planicorne]